MTQVKFFGEMEMENWKTPPSTWGILFWILKSRLEAYFFLWTVSVNSSMIESLWLSVELLWNILNQSKHVVSSLGDILLFYYSKIKILRTII